jgi:fucose permease
MIGVVFIALPFGGNNLAFLGLVTIGLGCAPVYPSIIHSTPSNFGKENSQVIIGIQMASAYIGSTFVPPLFGLIADYINIGVYPFFLMFFAVLMLLMSERLSGIIKRIRDNT